MARMTIRARAHSFLDKKILVPQLNLRDNGDLDGDQKNVTSRADSVASAMTHEHHVLESYRDDNNLSLKPLRRAQIDIEEL